MWEALVMFELVAIGISGARIQPEVRDKSSWCGMRRPAASLVAVFWVVCHGNAVGL